MKKKIVITFFLVLSFFVGALIVDLQKKKIETKNAILKNKSLKTIQSILDNHK
ncbi:MAG: hypothetical protein MJH09_00070 [Cetobacterium sp.]|nr:hypothetical protein [Cetobacterium sp.]